VSQVLKERPWVVAVVSLNALVVLNIPREIRLGREFLAFLSSCAGMVLMMATFGLTYFPYMVRSNPHLENSLTVINAASTEKTLGIMLVIALIGVPVVLAYTASIYYIFRGKVKLTSHSY
jgi:cytochrome d ubiquinol oxidase subunit II